jgi:hypothetical protein
MRERIETLTKERDTARKSEQDAQSQLRTLQAKDAFRVAGYKPESAELFVASHQGDITPDAVTAFAGKYGLPAIETVPAAESQPAEGAPESGKTQDPSTGSNLASMGRAGSGAGAGGQQAASEQPMPRDEWEKLAKDDPAAARAKVRAGQVQIRTDNPYATKASR